MSEEIKKTPVDGKKQGLKHHIKKNKHLAAWILLTVAVIAVCGAIIYFSTMNDKINIDKSMISADAINLAPTMGGALNEVFVNVGDSIPADTIVARVGNELVKTKVAGEIIDIKSDIGTLYGAGTPIATIVATGDLKVVGGLAEDKGLADVHIGQIAMFTVDAFGSKKYYGVVDEISPTSKESGVAFNISDKRETKEFNISVRFDNTAYSELKNGMSAKIWIYKK
jgi:multidrug resistance efflux pump